MLLPDRESEQVAPGVLLLAGRPRYAVNVYLVGDVLIDSGPPPAAARLLRQLEGREVAAHALTHAHPDHYGSSHKICEQLEIPLWVSAGDAEAAQSGKPVPARGTLAGRLIAKLPTPPGHPVDRRLAAGDRVADFEVIETPGHSPGHISFWRPADRVLILGDVLFNRHMLTGRDGLIYPPRAFTVDPERNARSIDQVVELEPELVLFGHGPPLRDPAALASFFD